MVNIDNFKKYTRFLSYIFIIINVAIFIIVELTGGSTNALHLIRFGAKFNPLILNGEWWRFITPMFLHIGLAHIIMNMITLYILGPLVERLFGKLRFLLIYLVSGIFGVIASFAFNENVSAGASGAIFGLFGALMFFGLIQRNFNIRIDLKQVLVLVIFNLGVGILIPSIDNSAHLGGLIGGFLTAAALHFPRYKKPLIQFAAILGLFVFGYITLKHGYQQDVSQYDYERALQFTGTLIQQDKLDEANKFIEYYVKNDLIAPQAFLYSGWIEYKHKNFVEAKELLEKAIEQDDDNAEAYYFLGLIYYEDNDYVNMKQYVNRAIELDPDEEKYQMFYESLMIK